MTASRPLLPTQTESSNIDAFCEQYCYNLCPTGKQCERCIEVLESPCPMFCECCNRMTCLENVGLALSIKTWLYPLMGEIFLHDDRIQCEDSNRYDFSSTRIVSSIGLGYSAFMGLCSICCLVNTVNKDEVERYKARRLLAINAISAAVTIIWNITLVLRSNNGC